MELSLSRSLSVCVAHEIAAQRGRETRIHEEGEGATVMGNEATTHPSQPAAAEKYGIAALAVNRMRDASTSSIGDLQSGGGEGGGVREAIDGEVELRLSDGASYGSVLYEFLASGC
uniref:Uncharacterized protein n=1 Tax=Physcomitrium patens TaxID=3218 RepID=A0A2K1IXI2_PHYPA|nr:hypothetical protein PHYPA_023806 [Physcomitrium patens]